MTKYCESCHTANRDRARYCQGCAGRFSGILTAANVSAESPTERRVARSGARIFHLPMTASAGLPAGMGSFAGHADGVANPYCLSESERAIKRALDIVGALAFLVLFSPLYLAVAIAVLIGMGGPVHYAQTRLGQGGRPFRCYKFRSMVNDADDVLELHLKSDATARTRWEAFQKLDDDPRVTRVGRFIRRLSLDELPQFLNVLKGDMSLVGPRPCMVRQRNLYGRNWHTYCHMRPGITGLWQVSGRNRLSYADRVALDAQYVAGWSLQLDARILARTFWVVLSGHGTS